ncbi:hypothetical protein DOTSEDRAFT_75047 [Dothistroma septosporum NZE10]|uniref:Uncharacterized protein n=1 Tax=Dothistroma septosporum (strain NZE10 / CBS 128990) TaxID=675120 RepID=M2XI69_DOTSN|nr:hypothetical protein DOTSEDRAFT_75047 [Dothistroma septosporum NZE10]
MILFAFVTGDDLRKVSQRPDPKDSVLDESSFAWHLTRGTGLSVLVGASWLYALYSTIDMGFLVPDFSGLDLSPSPMPHADLDIVVARYVEPPAGLAEDIMSLLATPKVQNLKTSMIIYNKDTDEEDFKARLLTNLADRSKIVFRSLENVGWEAVTHLHHIVQNWDHLSKHSLLMQAEPHDLPMVKQ